MGRKSGTPGQIADRLALSLQVTSPAARDIGAKQPMGKGASISSFQTMQKMVDSNAASPCLIRERSISAV